MVVNLASVDTEEQMVNWVGLLKYSKYWKQNACTWDGRVAFWSAARRAKSTIESSGPYKGSPRPLSRTLKAELAKSCWARRNIFVNSCMASVSKIGRMSTRSISEKQKGFHGVSNCITLGLLFTRERLALDSFYWLDGCSFVTTHHGESHHAQNTNCLTMGTSLISYS